MTCLTFLPLIYCVCIYVYSMLCMQRSADNFQELILSFCHTDPQDWTQMSPERSHLKFQFLGFIFASDLFHLHWPCIQTKCASLINNSPDSPVESLAFYSH